MKKKTIALLLVLMLVFGVTCGGTIAYLTSQTDTIENTFTVGKVQIKLDEALVDLYGAKIEGKESVRIPNADEAYEGVIGNAYKLIPGHTYTKDPTIHVQPGSEKCYVFVKVDNEIAAIEATGNTAIAEQIKANDWNQLKDATGKDVAGVYYKTQDAIAENAQAVDLVVFENFTLADEADVVYDPEVKDDVDYSNAKIIVTGYAVQFDGFEPSESNAQNGAYDAWSNTFGKPSNT